MLSEVDGVDRLNALNTHRDFLKRELQRAGESTTLSDELRRVEEILQVTLSTVESPKNHWVIVHKSRVAQPGSVGRVIYVSSKEKNHARVEFGDGEKVSCAITNVEVIDWEPLPAFIPMAGELVTDFRNGQTLTVVEWTPVDAKVHAQGFPSDSFWANRDYLTRQFKS